MTTYLQHYQRFMNFVLALVASLFAFVNVGFSQCGTAAFKTNSGWCDNYYAKWEINGTIPAGTKYHWYYEDGSSIVDVGYGPKGNGSVITTPYRCSAADGSSVTMLYSKEGEATKINPSSGKNFNYLNNSETNSEFYSNLSFPFDVHLTSFTIPTKTWASGDITFTTTIRGTTTYTVSTVVNATELAGGFLTIVVDKDIKKGDYSVTVKVSESNGQLGWSDNTLSAFTDSYGTIITPTAKSIYGGSKYSMLYDLNYTFKCDRKESPASNLRTTNCCDPVYGNDVWISATSEYLESGESTTLTVTQYNDKDNNYFVWYKDGTQIKSGKGLVEYTTSTTGLYSVRETKSTTSQYLNEESCYTEGIIDIQKKMFQVVNNDEAPSYCYGSKIELEALPNTGVSLSNVSWTPAALFENPNGKTAIASLGAEGNITFEATATIYEDCKIINGDFEAGKTGFSSDYTIKTDGSIPDGQNALISDKGTTGYVGSVNYKGAGWKNNVAYWTKDNTQTGTQCTGDGKFMIIDGKSGQRGYTVWEETVTGLTTNKEYEFSMDVANIGWGDLEKNPITMGNAAPLDVYINGVLLFSTSPNNEWCMWESKSARWNSENATSADIKIVQQCPSDNGYDFALDNVNFGVPRIQKDRVTIPVTDCYEVEIENNNCILTAKAVNSSTGEIVGQVDHWEDESGTIVGYGSTFDASEIAEKGTYKAVAYFPAGSVISNGDFEFGVSGFKYGNANKLYDEGNQVGSFRILKGEDIVPNTACGQWCVRVDDHTSGTGNMLFVDPKSDDGDVIAYDFEAIKDKAYILSLYFANACRFTDRNPLPFSAQLSFIVENNTTGVKEVIVTKQLSDNNDWEDLSAVWTAPSDGSFTLYIRAAGDNTLNAYYGTGANQRSGGNDFVIDDISFATSLDKVYEAEIEVTPCISCTEPTAVTLTPSGRTDGYMCDGETVTLTTNAQVNTTGFQFDWYKGETIDDGTPVTNKIGRTGISSDSYSISDVDDAGTYWVRVSDAKYPTAETCWKETSFTITPAEKPTVTITGGDTYCKGETVEAPTFTFTGTPPFKFQYSTDGGTTKSSWITGYTSTTYSPSAPTAEGNYKYVLTSLSDAYCEADDLTSTTTISILPQPKITKLETSGDDCEGNPLKLIVSTSNASGSSYFYTDYLGKEQPGPITQDLNQEIVIAASATPAHSGTYALKIELAQCTDEKSVTVTIYPQPQITSVTPSPAAVCSGEEITFTPVITNKGTGTASYSWVGTQTASTETVKVQQNVTAETTVEETLTYTEKYSETLSCTATSAKATAVINPLPTPSITRSKASVCYNIEDVNLSLNTTYASQKWTCSPTVSGFSATSATPKLAKGTSNGTYTIGVEVTDANGCVAEAEDVQVTINSNLSPEIATSSTAFCKNETTTLSLPDQTYSKVTWKEGTTTIGSDATCTYGSGKNEGDYTITVNVEDVNGCTGTNTTTVKIHPLPVVRLTPDVIAICDLTSAEVTAEVVSGDDGNGGKAVVGTWSGNGLTPDASNPLKALFTANGYDNNTVSFDYVSSYGCNVASPIPSKDITVYDIPATLQEKTKQYCVGQSSSSSDLVSLYSDAVGTLTWYESEDGAPLAFAPTPSTASDGTTYYYVTQTTNRCESEKAKVTVIVNPLPAPEIISKVSGTEKDNACLGTPIALSVKNTKANSADFKKYTWSYSPTGTGYFGATNEATTSLTASAKADTYSVELIVEDANGCKNATAAQKQLIVHPIPMATLSTLTAKCADDETAQTITATIQPSGLTGTGTWSNNVTKTDQTTASFTPKSVGAGSHSITYDFTSEAGCVAPQETTLVDVFTMPDISISPSLTEVCEQGSDKSGEITIAMSGTYASTGAKTPMFNYTSTTLSGVDAATGKFSSVGQKAGTHTINLAYADANGCSATASTTIKIDAKPIIDFDLQDAICDYASAINLVGKVKYEDGDFATITTGTSSFTGTGGVSDSKFTPTGLTGSKDIALAYTDANGCKADDIKHSIVVNHTDVPEPVSTSDSKLNVVNQAAVPLLSVNGATGATFKWYLADDTTSTVVASTQTYQIEFVADTDTKMKKGQYPAFVTQTVNGCQSTPAKAILTITDCPITQPTSVKYYACEGQDGIEISATSTYTANPESDDTKKIGWFWDNQMIPVTTVASLADANPDGTGYSFTIPAEKLVAGSVSIYVAEYSAESGLECFSPATAVTVEVHANPQPTITVPDVICSTVGSVEISFGPATAGNVTSSLSAESGHGTITDNKNWSVFVADDTKTALTETQLTVKTDEVWGEGTPQEKTCTGSKTETFTVTHVVAPTGTGIGTPQIWSSSVEKIGLVPNMEISYATDLSATLSVKNAETSAEIGTASPISMKSQITAEGTYNYNVQQWVNGCASPVAVSTWNIVDCPTPAPTAESKTLCSKTDDLQAAFLPTLEAQNVGNQTNVWEWYSDAEGTNLVGTGQNLSLEGLSGYTSNVTAETVYTLYVRQNGNDGTGGTDMCFGPLSAPITVTVYPNPVVEITSPNDVLCYYDEKKMAKATVNGKDLAELSTGTGGWKFFEGTTENADGIDAVTGEINLQIKAESDGNYTIQYEYTDANTCFGKASKDIEIEFAETPTTTIVKRLTIDESDVKLTAGNIATKTGTLVNWYESEITTATLSNDNPWVTNDAKTVEISKSYYVSQTIQGCESKREEQKLTIIKCPFEAPSVANVKTCQDVAFDEIVASTGEAVDEWLWYRADSDDNLTPITNDNAVFNPTASINTVGTTTYYVSYLATEANTLAQCESKKAKVTATVLPLPAISFDGNPSYVCYDLGMRQLTKQVDFHQNGEGSGVWTIDDEDGSAITADGEFMSNFKSVADESVSEFPTYTLRYSYTDGEGCQNSETTTIKVQYVAKPVLSHQYTMTSQNIDAELTATLDAGDTARWYANTVDSYVLATVVTENGANKWKTGDKGNVVVSKSYFATQIENGCESQRAETTVDIVPCPIPAPKTIGNVMCNYDETKELTATVGTWAQRPNGVAELFYWYDAAGNRVDDGTNSTGVFIPNVDKSEANEFTFYVSEYNHQPIADLTTQAGCESPKTAVVMTVKKTATANIVAKSESVCEWPEGENPEMSATGYVGNGTFYWYEENPNYPACQPSENVGFKYTSSSVEVGVHTVWLVVFDDGCYSEPTSKDFTIKPIPMKPEVVADSVCEDIPNKAVSAVSEKGYITWYSDASRSKNKLLKANSPTYTSKETMTGRYYYYATQTVDGCQSQAAEVMYRIIDLPRIPEIITNEYHYCEYDNPPLLKAHSDSANALIRWYLADKKSYANADMENGYSDTYQLESLTQGRNSLYVTQTIEGCEGPMASLGFYVYAKPSSPVVNDAAMCEGSTAIPSLSTNLYIDKWYADEMASQYIQSGYTYTPDSSLVKQSNLTYYVLREQNNCFSDTVPVTLQIVRTPTISLGEDTAFCIYDTLAPVVANVTPKFTKDSENSFVWYISPNVLSRPVEALDTFNIEEYKNTLSGKTVDYTVRAQYVVKVNDLLTCKSEFDTVHYIVNERGRKPVVFSTVICEDVDIQPLQALGTPNIEWKSLDGILPEVWHGQKYEFAHGQQLDTGQFRFVVCDADMVTGCKSLYDSLTMTVAPAARTKIIGEDSTCINETLYYYSEYAQGSEYHWQVTGDVLNYSKAGSSSAVRYFDFNERGVDTITLYERTWAGCEGFDTLLVTVGPKPVAMFSWTMPGASNIVELKDSTLQDTVWKKNEAGEMVGEPIQYTMYWNFGHQGEATEYIDTVITFDKRNFSIVEGDYTFGYNCPILTVENSFGCRDSYTECVYVNIMTGLYMPTAFSPSNPAHSVRTFQPKGFNLKTCEVSVYDKWGNMLWYSNDVQDGRFVGYWDGRYDGKMMKSDVYIWKMEATFIDGQIWEGFDAGNGKKTKFGSVTLIR